VLQVSLLVRERLPENRFALPAIGLMRDKWNRDDYRQRTIERANRVDRRDLRAAEGNRITTKREKAEQATTDPECFLEPLTDSDPDSTDQYEWLIPDLVPKGEPMAIVGKGRAANHHKLWRFRRELWNQTQRRVWSISARKEPTGIPKLRPEKWV